MASGTDRAAIAVTGATGQVGSLVARALIRRDVPLRALVRDPLRAAWLRNQPLVDLAVASSTDPEALASALAEIEVLILIPPFESYMPAFEEALRDAAITAGVRRVVRLSGVGASEQAESRTLRMHRRGEIALAESGLDWKNLRANAFHQNAAWLMQWVLSSNEIYGTDLREPVAWVDARDVADCLVACAADEVDGREFELSGPESLTWQELARGLGGAVGLPVDYVPLGRPALRRLMIASRWESWPANEWITMFDGEHFKSGSGARVTDAVAELTGRQPLAFAEYATALLPRPLALDGR